jgi:hypothetical protein
VSQIPARENSAFVGAVVNEIEHKMNACDYYMYRKKTVTCRTCLVHAMQCKGKRNKSTPAMYVNIVGQSINLIGSSKVTEMGELAVDRGSVVPAAAMQFMGEHTHAAIPCGNPLWYKRRSLAS